jgi:hypothetical protein
MISRWVVPCYFTEEKHKVDPIIFDLTPHIKTIFKNEVWNRKFSYGFNTGLKNTDPDEIKKATVKIFPRFISGAVYEDRIASLVEKECGKLPPHLKLKNYKEWSYRLGLAIIETEYEPGIKKLPSKKDLTGDFPYYNKEFIEAYHRHIAVLKELSAFFLAALHLTFPTQSFIMRDDNPVNDGFVQFTSGRQSYGSKIATNAFMHEILIQPSKQQNIEYNLSGLAAVWHFDLWPLKRYLDAVASDQTSMDHLLDLIYALEGLFDKQASSDFIKTTCLLTLCANQKEAKKLKSLLDLAYRIRNDIAHGGRSYDPYDWVSLDGKEILAQQVYWEMKGIVAIMIVKATSKLLHNKEMRNLRFNTDDFISMAFAKK